MIFDVRRARVIGPALPLAIAERPRQANAARAREGVRDDLSTIELHGASVLLERAGGGVEVGDTTSEPRRSRIRSVFPVDRGSWRVAFVSVWVSKLPTANCQPATRDDYSGNSMRFPVSMSSDKTVQQWL